VICADILLKIDFCFISHLERELFTNVVGFVSEVFSGGLAGGKNAGSRIFFV